VLPGEGSANGGRAEPGLAGDDEGVAAAGPTLSKLATDQRDRGFQEEYVEVQSEIFLRFKNVIFYRSCVLQAKMSAGQCRVDLYYLCAVCTISSHKK
jgi:hypothetical protein